ncbi:MAG: hypothetical protein ACI8W8_005032 [Rhodothermales bacterium]|jgi:hypothetical protein
MRFVLLILVLANSAIASDFESAGQLFAEKKFVEAFAGFEAASLVSHSPTLRQACFYNMGNCAFRVAEEDESMPMEWYRQSIQCFRAALRLGAGEDAAFNLELASWRMKQFDDNSPQDSDQPSDESDPSDEGEGEGESSESGEEGEMEEEGDYSEDAEAADSSSMPRGDTGMSDLESQTTPPPGVTPDDLLQEEALNNAQRQKSKSRKGGGVEQDW